MSKVVFAGTGHRPNKLGGYADPLPRGLARQFLEECRPDEVISGMALGWDTCIALAARDLGIPYVAAIPFEGQEHKWPEQSRRVYGAIRKGAAREIVISSAGYSAEAMQKRNEWMVDNCTLLIALWDGSDGGTANCVRYAERAGRLTINLWGRYREYVRLARR